MDELTILISSSDIRLPLSIKRIHTEFEYWVNKLYIQMAHTSRTKFTYKGVDCPVYDYQERSWKNLNFFQNECYIYGRIPRVKASEKDEEGRDIKYFGQPYWSAEAGLAYNNGLQNGKAKNVLRKNFRHDHAVSRKVLLSKIGESGKNAAEVLSILNIYLHSVVVTKDEDTLLNEKGLNATMPSGLIDDASERYVFGSYQNAGIEVVSGVGF